MLATKGKVVEMEMGLMAEQMKLEMARAETLRVQLMVIQEQKTQARVGGQQQAGRRSSGV